MEQVEKDLHAGTSREAEEKYFEEAMEVIRSNVANYTGQVQQMSEDIDEMLRHYHDDNAEMFTILNNTVTLHDHLERELKRNEKALNKPYFGRIIFQDEELGKEESIYIGKGGISKDPTHQVVTDWRAPVASAYYENGIGKCSYQAPGGRFYIDLKLKRTYEIENGEFLDYFDSEVVATDELLTKYLSKNKQTVLKEIVATIQKEQNDIIRKTPFHNIIVQGVAGSGKTTVAMHRISYILYNFPERIRPDDFYIVGSNRILLNYITGVLPDLDVQGVRQMTMEQLFVRLLYEDWDEKKYHIRSMDKKENRGSIKGSLDWFQKLREYCRRLEWNTIPREDVFLNPQQFVELFRDGKPEICDLRKEMADKKRRILLMSRDEVEDYLRQNPGISLQSKIDMLNGRLMNRIQNELLRQGRADMGKKQEGVYRKYSYTQLEKKAIRKAYRGHYGGRAWNRSIFVIYLEFLKKMQDQGADVELPEEAFDVYDLAALAYLYKRLKETDEICEARHIVIDEAQDFGMMAYCVLKFCIKGCSYTVMGDVSQNIHFGYGLNDWEELKTLLLTDPMDSFGLLKKSYRNTVEISNFATRILDHGQFFTYPVEPIIRHGLPVQVREAAGRSAMMRQAAEILGNWQQEKEFSTIAVICRDREGADRAAKELGKQVELLENDLEKAVFESGILVLPVEYTKGLEFDAVLILDPTREEYPVDDGHAKLLYVAATRALHELCVIHTGNLTGLIADPVPKRKRVNKTDETSEKKAEEIMLQKFAEEVAKPAVAIPRKSVPEAAAIPQKSASDVTSASPQKSASDVTSASPQKSTFGPASYMPVIVKGNASTIVLGGTPEANKLQPAGHAAIDLAVRWVMKKPDGLYMQSRYGILRLSPICSDIIRVTFSRGGALRENVHPKIAVRQTERFWYYKESFQVVELLTEDLILSVNKKNGAVSYMTRVRKILMSEREKDCRVLEAGAGGTQRAWLFPDWAKQERLYSPELVKRKQELSGMARYLSTGAPEEKLPFLCSGKGYGILLATDGPTICCHMPAYGFYLYTEKVEQLDFYFIGGESEESILKGRDYLCGVK